MLIDSMRGVQKDATKAYGWPEKMEEWNCHLICESPVHITVLKGAGLGHEKCSLKLV